MVGHFLVVNTEAFELQAKGRHDPLRGTAYGAHRRSHDGLGARRPLVAVAAGEGVTVTKHCSITRLFGCLDNYCFSIFVCVKKELYIIAGCNGAGKTTASFTILPNILNCREFVNADEIARGLSPFQPEKDSFEAGRILIFDNSMGKSDLIAEKNRDSEVEVLNATKFNQLKNQYHEIV
jgi:hypothetical protein